MTVGIARIRTDLSWSREKPPRSGESSASLGWAEAEVPALPQAVEFAADVVGEAACGVGE
jgi:hypothetical protein